ncbi:hypothetical protein ILYODFUR_017560 [Ilyodon furcidens]|uniref:Uncharacterized protein n=1 Tax=Ilyodon furcidens TaxID=33524 RepID=A0ABV0T8W2_9TELE
MNLPQSKDLPDPSDQTAEYPPSNISHQLGEPAHTAYQSVSLSFCGLLTSPSFNRFIKSKPCFFLFLIQTIFQVITIISPSVSRFLKPDDYGTPILPENIISVNLFKPLPASELCCRTVTLFWFNFVHSEWSAEHVVCARLQKYDQAQQ